EIGVVPQHVVCADGVAELLPGTGDAGLRGGILRGESPQRQNGRRTEAGMKHGSPLVATRDCQVRLVCEVQGRIQRRALQRHLTVAATPPPFYPLRPLTAYTGGAGDGDRLYDPFLRALPRAARRRGRDRDCHHGLEPCRTAAA